MSFTKVAPAGIGTEPGTSILIGDSLLHSTGIDIGSNTGIGVTIRKHGDATFTGIITASAFFGDGSGLEGVSSSGIGTPLSDDDTSELNKVYYVNQELSIGSTVTVNHPDSAIASYTHYQDLVVKDNADFIVSDGDTFIPDVLGINTASLPNPVSGATGGRIRTGTITNAGANGAPNFPNGLTGTAGTFTGNLNVGGVLTYEDVTNVDSIGVITARSGIDAASNLLLKTGGNERLRITSNGDFGLNDTSPTAHASGNNTVLSIKGKGSSYSGKIDFKDSDGNIDSFINSDNSILQFYADPNSQNGNTLMRFFVHGGERVRIASAGQIGLGGANYGTSGQVLTSQGASSAVQWATPSSGLSDFDTWYLTQDTVGNTNPVQNNWSRWTNHGGTGSVTFAAPSSGIWTFPSTGYWLIEWYGRFAITNAQERGCNADIYVTTNNSYYAFVTQASCNMGFSHSSGVKGVARASYIFDVTDVSTHKMKLASGYQMVSGTLTGHSAYLYSHVKFFKLRDT